MQSRMRSDSALQGAVLAAHGRAHACIRSCALIPGTKQILRNLAAGEMLVIMPQKHSGGGRARDGGTAGSCRRGGFDCRFPQVGVVGRACGVWQLLGVLRWSGLGAREVGDAQESRKCVRAKRWGCFNACTHSCRWAAVGPWSAGAAAPFSPPARCGAQADKWANLGQSRPWAQLVIFLLL